MRIECPQCDKLFEAGAAQIADAEVRFSCTHCDSLVAIAVAGEDQPPAASVQSKAPIAAEASCPKCAAPVEPALEACPGCGLASARFGDYKADKGQEDHALEDAWQVVEGDWNSEEVHEAFMRCVAIAGDYRAAASRYRVTQSVSGREQRSRKMLDRIQTMATATLLASSPKGAKKKAAVKGPVILVLVLCLFVAAGGVYFLFVKARNSQPKGNEIYAPVRVPSATSKPDRFQPVPGKGKR